MMYNYRNDENKEEFKEDFDAVNDDYSKAVALAGIKESSCATCRELVNEFLAHKSANALQFRLMDDSCVDRLNYNMMPEYCL